jgi:homoserine kinase
MSSKFRLRLPATSANLGPGFDSAAVALSFFLDIEANPAAEFSINATGRNSDLCSQLENNLILTTYARILREQSRNVQPLALTMHNEIPLGMGCGSSAAGRLAAVAMAAHFGDLSWDSDRILEEACALEGHPDNAAACWLGGFVAAAHEGRTVRVARVCPPEDWRVILALPPESLATSTARAVLPSEYSSSDVVANLQSVLMLGVAFAQGRGDLLQTAMKDRIHQPYRAGICPLLPRLLPLAGADSILGVALSGAGPAVLVVIESQKNIEQASERILGAVDAGTEPFLLVCSFQNSGAATSFGA